MAIKAPLCVSESCISLLVLHSYISNRVMETQFQRFLLLLLSDCCLLLSSSLLFILLPSLTQISRDTNLWINALPSRLSYSPLYRSSRLGDLSHSCSSSFSSTVISPGPRTHSLKCMRITQPSVWWELVLFYPEMLFQTVDWYFRGLSMSPNLYCITWPTGGSLSRFKSDQFCFRLFGGLI